MRVTSYVDGDDRRTWNSFVYSRFLVIGFDKRVDPYQPIVKSISEKIARWKKEKKYCLPEAAPMIPQHQAKSKETTRVVNQGTLERSVRGEEGRGWALVVLIIDLGGGSVAGTCASESHWKIRKKGKRKIYLLKFIYEATGSIHSLKFFANEAAWIRRKVNLNLTSK